MAKNEAPHEESKASAPKLSDEQKSVLEAMKNQKEADVAKREKRRGGLDAERLAKVARGRMAVAQKRDNPQALAKAIKLNALDLGMSVEDYRAATGL